MQPASSQTSSPLQDEQTTSLVESLKKIILDDHDEQLKRIELRLDQLEHVIKPQVLKKSTLNPTPQTSVDTHRLEGISQNFQELLRQESATRQQEIKRITQQLSLPQTPSAPAQNLDLNTQVTEISGKMAQLIDQRINELGETMNSLLQTEITKLKAATSAELATQLKASSTSSLEQLNQRLQKIAEATLPNA